MTAEQRILAWLERADFDGTGCRHSQDTIAAATNCNRRTVIRATQNLAAQGLITVGKERRPGCKWLCNVYRVRDWNPQKRAGVLNVLAAIRDARQTQCHTERTARSSRAHTTPQDPSSPRSVCGRARGTHHIPARRGYVCDDCQRLAHEKADLKAVIAGQDHTIRSLGYEVVGMKAEMTKRAKSSPNAVQIECVLLNWMRLCRGRTPGDGKKGRLPVIDADSKRWKIVARALKSHDLVDCLEAIEGLAAMPFNTNVPPFRAANGLPSERKDDIEYALKDEGQIEKARMWRAQALGASERALFDAWMTASASEHFYLSAWLGKRARDEFKLMPEYKQVAHRMRIAEAFDDAEQARVIDINTRRNVA